MRNYWLPLIAAVSDCMTCVKTANNRQSEREARLMRLLCASVCMCGHSCSVYSGQCPFLLIVRRYIGFLHVTLLPCHFGAENQSNSFEMRGQLRNFKAEIMDDSVGGC